MHLTLVIDVYIAAVAVVFQAWTTVPQTYLTWSYWSYVLTAKQKVIQYISLTAASQFVHSDSGLRTSTCMVSCIRIDNVHYLFPKVSWTNGLMWLHCSSLDFPNKSIPKMCLDVNICESNHPMPCWWWVSYDQLGSCILAGRFSLFSVYSRQTPDSNQFWLLCDDWQGQARTELVPSWSKSTLNL